MNVKDMLKINSLEDAKLIAGKNGILNEISGVNVLEAIDIENWGRFGEVILTSFFALQGLDDSELDLFFNKLHSIGISAVIIKTDRLVTFIPDKIIEMCDKHPIPLIQIGKGIKYETIILEILGPIINKNVTLLHKYYEVHSELTRLALKMPTLLEILNKFRKMLLHDVSLINTANGTEISTNPALCDAAVINTREVKNESYMHFRYERKEVIYTGFDPKITGSQIRVSVPYLGFDEYKLVVHEQQDPVSSEDFMVIENGVKFLQVELLKKYVVSQNIYQQKNSIISDVLNDRFYEQKDIDEVLESLKINSHKFYQVTIIRLYQRDENKNLDKNLIIQALRQIRDRYKLSYKDIAYMEKTDRIVFLLNFSESQNGFSIDSVEGIMNFLVENQLLKDFYYRVSISSKVEKSGIPKANLEALDTQKILRLFSNSNKISSYEDLGIYKLFLEANSPDELEKFISPRIKKFRMEHPLLFKTLSVFLDTNQNYLLTSEKLFLHPKTVRYRIDKIKDVLRTELTDPEEILQIQIASRLFELINGGK